MATSAPRLATPTRAKEAAQEVRPARQARTHLRGGAPRGDEAAAAPVTLPPPKAVAVAAAAAAAADVETAASDFDADTAFDAIPDNEEHSSGAGAQLPSAGRAGASLPSATKALVPALAPLLPAPAPRRARAPARARAAKASRQAMETPTDLLDEALAVPKASRQAMETPTDLSDEALVVPKAPKSGSVTARMLDMLDGEQQEAVEAARAEAAPAAPVAPAALGADAQAPPAVATVVASGFDADAASDAIPDGAQNGGDATVQQSSARHAGARRQPSMKARPHGGKNAAPKSGVVQQGATPLQKALPESQTQSEDKDDDDALTAWSGVQKTSGANSKPAEVVYDDDDLPQHHPRPMAADLRGGWKSFLHKHGTGNVKPPKLDADVALMESLYAGGGALPSQYSAWKPHGEAKTAAVADSKDTNDKDDESPGGISDSKKPDSDSSDDGNSNAGPIDFAQAAKELEDDSTDDASIHEKAAPPSFAQLASRTERARRGDAATAVVEGSVAAAASALLGSFADALHSPTLTRLSQARPSPGSLKELSARLRAADPLVAKRSNANEGATDLEASGDDKSTERWCVYLQHNAASAEPLKLALEAVENASDALAEADAKRNALVEEVAARTQLGRAVAQDVSSLSRVLSSEKAEASSEEDSEARAEIADVLEAARAQRTGVAKARRASLEHAQQAAAAAEKERSSREAILTSAKTRLEAARIQLVGLQKSCGQALVDVDRRHHAAHLEARAVELAAEVLSGDGPLSK